MFMSFGIDTVTFVGMHFPHPLHLYPPLHGAGDAVIDSQGTDGTRTIAVSTLDRGPTKHREVPTRPSPSRPWKIAPGGAHRPSLKHSDYVQLKFVQRNADRK